MSLFLKSSQIDAQFIVASDPTEQNLADFMRLIHKYRPDYIVSMSSAVCAFEITGTVKNKPLFYFRVGSIFCEKQVN